MPISITPADLEKDDLFPCEMASWQHPFQPLWYLLFPIDSSTPETEAASIAAIRTRRAAGQSAPPPPQNEEEVVWLKATDTATGEIVGGAMYRIFHTNPFRAPAEEFKAEWWSEKGREDLRWLTESMMGQMKVWRPRFVSYLNALFVHPSHRRRGIGSLLTEWGARKADALNYEAYIEGTALGTPVYEKHGYVTMKMLRLNFDHYQGEMGEKSEEFIGLRRQLEASEAALMWRPRGGKYIKGETVLPWTGKPAEV
ncbi:hypothetical protein MMC25_000495 [Agyrium rufum]|nr:hypothetical protein [Agyrium rufum]